MPDKTHSNYDHYNPEMIHRLDGFFGEVDARMNQRISEHAYGTTILDIGCGFGQLVDFLRRNKYIAVGTDMLNACIKAGKIQFPEADLHWVPDGSINFPDQYFDTVILKDTIHHIFEENDLHKFLLDICRICRHRIIIHDPNPTLILKLSRLIIRHMDPICPPKIVKQELTKVGFTVVNEKFTDVFAFPISGGFVGKPLVHTKKLYKSLLKMDALLENILTHLKIAKFFCWRYFIVADRN